ncbi:MAG: AIR synthase-related protein, partial [Mariprofundaceae bacterium]|nr:AIR synthase-related protein [Mariprofundaceae bacterium]
AVLAPTRLYVPAVKALIKSAVDVHGYSHITGGGMFDNIERILPEGLAATVHTKSWEVLPVFKYLLNFANVERDEAYRTFNMGIGFVVILPESEVEKTKEVLEKAGETVYQMGHIHAQSGDVVQLID